MRFIVLFLLFLTAGPASAVTLTIAPAPPPTSDASPEVVPEAGESPPDLLPQSEVAHGAGPIVQAWLSTPTDRYAHGVLGDGLEASSLVIVTTGEQALRVDLPADMVFEDLAPRIVDVDGDGLHESVLTVRSGLDTGAALVVLRVREGTVSVTAGEALGQPNRWLNPIGVADLDADGRQEIAVVETPHIGGTLRIYRWQDTGLQPLASDRGYSNHVLGSSILALHAISDLIGDDRPEILLPGAERTTLKLVGLERDGTLTVHQTWDLPAEAVGPVSVLDDGAVLVPLADGREAVVRREAGESPG